MSKPTIKIHDVETGEVVEREMNAEEFAQWQQDQTKAAELSSRIAEAAVAKAALLAKLGITEEEARLLIG